MQWFIDLSPDYKSKYIGRGHSLSDKQFDFIFDGNQERLIKQYVSVGKKLNDYQMKKLFAAKGKKADFVSNYIHNRVLANMHIEDMSVEEYNKAKQLKLDALLVEKKNAAFFAKMDDYDRYKDAYRKEYKDFESATGENSNSKILSQIQFIAAASDSVYDKFINGFLI